MFGKTKELSEVEILDGSTDITIDDFFGDEAAVAEAVRVDQLHQRVSNVEQQISSQFTSLAAYAQIAQEQVELVRSEASHANERSEQRVIELIERERSDRQASSSGGAVDVTARLDSMDAQIAEIRDGLQQCLSNQKALADAISDLFAPITESAGPATTPDTATPAMPAPLTAAPAMPAPAAAPLRETLAPPAPSFPATEPLASDTDAESASDSITDSDDEFVAIEPIEPIEPMVRLLDGPIDGLSLA